MVDLSPSGKLVHIYSNQWIILDRSTNQQQNLLLMVLGVCLLPLPKPQTSQNKMETAEPLTRKEMLVSTVNPFIVYGCLNPQFLESLKKQ